MWPRWAEAGRCLLPPGPLSQAEEPGASPALRYPWGLPGEKAPGCAPCGHLPNKPDGVSFVFSSLGVFISTADPRIHAEAE